jgi:hypothetical protein
MTTEPDPAFEPAPKPDPKPAPRGSVPEVFGREYVDHLKATAAQHQAEAAAARQEAEAAKAAAETRATETEKAANARIIRAEVRAAAIAAGMVDPDGIAMLDLSKVKLDDKGAVVIPDGYFEAVKAAKPYLFGVGGTSVPGNPPPANPPAAKRATEMTDAEYSAAKAEMIKRR